MQIKRSSWHCKISNLGSPERANDNLCCYFWRFVGKLSLFFVVGFFLYLVLYIYFTDDLLIANTIMLVFLCLSFAFPSLAIHFIRKRLGKSLEMPYGNIVIEYLAAKKRKVCPLIRYI